LIINSAILDGIIKTDSAYDYAQRMPFESCDVTDSNTHHNATMFEISKDGKALAVYTEGQHEVEYSNGYALITILRSFGAINRHPITLKIMEGAAWGIEEGQSLREVEGRLAFEYGVQKDGATLWSNAKFFRNGFLVHSDSFDYKKYSGGRFAVQSSELEKLYYVPDVYENCKVSGDSVVSVEDGNIAITCVKQGISGGKVVRFVNLSDETVSVKVNLKGDIYITDMSEQSFEKIGNDTVVLTFTPKQIITLKGE
jgi:alpha-mannosidase